ncbi:MAG: nuclear transport factor 2 family protein [Candidatus Nanopelagicales bacterium]
MASTAHDLREDNRTLIRRYAEAWSSGDIRSAMSFYSEDVVLRLPGRNPFAGTFEGRDEVVSAIEAIRGSFDDLPEVDVHEVLVGEEHVAVLATESGRRGGREITFRRIVVYGCTDGEICSITVFHEDAYEVDTFFS